MENTRINVTRSSMPPLEEYIEEIRPVFESRILTNMGPIYQKLKTQLAAYLDVPHLSMFVNGHMALEMSIQALGLKATGEREGSEVITTPFTFVSTTHAISRNNLKPVFCDIRESDYTMDPEKIEDLITDRTVAIIPVHVYGSICDVDAIESVAKRHGLKVIYDAAHAFGVRYRGVGVGNFGDASMFSFHATKVFHTIEGGAVSFRDPSFADALHELKNFGLHTQEDVPSIGGNAKMNEFAAAMGICNLRRIEVCLARRRAAYERYLERLDGVPGLTLWKPQPEATPNYAYMPVRFDPERFGKTRDEVAQALAAQDIYARKYFYPAVNEMRCYRRLSGCPTPVAHTVSEQILTLPMYEELSADDVDRICDAVLGIR